MLDWQQWRGVLFLDPFATEISWSTIEKIADFNALDMWILFPTQAISRILPREQRPEDIEPRWMDRLDRIYGNDSWKALYRQNPQGDLFGHSGHQRDRGVEGLTSIYRSNLESLFGNRFLQKTRKLRNSKNAVLFEFLFCVGNERGKGSCLAGRQLYSGRPIVSRYAACFSQVGNPSQVRPSKRRPPLFWISASPLLEEERDPLIATGVPQGASPIGMHGAGTGTAFATDNGPSDTR